MGSLYGEAFIYFHEGYARLVQGRLRDAEALFREGHELAEEHFGGGSDLVAVARAFLAEVAYEKNDTHEAAQLLAQALPHIEQFDSWQEVYLAGYLTAIRLARSRRDATELAQLARRMRSTASARELPGLRAVMDAWLQDLAWQDPAYALEADPRSIVFDPILDPPDGDPLFDPALRHALVSARARRLVRENQLRDAAALLAAEAARAYRARHIRAFISLSVLLAITHSQLHQPAEARSALETAVAAAVFEGNKRPFIDAGIDLLPVLAELARASAGHRSNRLRDRFLAEVQLEIRNAGATPGESHPLSPREREVLGHLIQGRSNAEIGVAVSLSLNTVKFHVKNIFEKLAVSTRQGAVTAAIRKGLI
jgi:LuxR family maltose regulon positive regulatory protein